MANRARVKWLLRLPIESACIVLSIHHRRRQKKSLALGSTSITAEWRQQQHLLSALQGGILIIS
jgi:hypothetical protein